LPDGVHILKPKIPIWVNFGKPWIEKIEYYIVICNMHVYYGHLVFIMAIWHFSPFWYIMKRKIWQPWSSVQTFAKAPRLGIRFLPFCRAQ
jgi:hypothetical protein